MAESPRMRRLRADRRALETLKSESSVFDFVARGEMPDTYTLLFNGKGVWRADPTWPVAIRERHEVYLRLGAAYPRMMPELTWRSPIFHPNISGSGVVCLGGYGTYWVPSLSLDELCTMLWDMIRYANYDPNSPYNREAAVWAKHQTEFAFPLDPRPIRDRVARQGRAADTSRGSGLHSKSSGPISPRVVRTQGSATTPASGALVPSVPSPSVSSPRAPASPPAAESHGILFLDNGEVLEAEIIDDGATGGEPEIVFID